MIDLFETKEIFELYIQAGGDAISSDELARFSQYGHRRVRLRVAENCRTPKDCLELLAKDECPEVRLAVATNPAVSAAVIQSLATDDDPTVRYEMAENPNLPLSILEQLASDENPYVSSRAARTMFSLAALTLEPPECHPYFRSSTPPSKAKAQGQL